MRAHIVAVIIALFVLALPHLPAAEAVMLENEFVRLVVNAGPNEAGRFSIRTTGGDPSRPSSSNKHLIFGTSAPWTSYSTIMVDGQPYVFGGPTQRRAGQTGTYGTAVTLPTLADGAVTTAYRLGDIHVAQELRIVRGLSTRMLDTVGITYRLTNRGTTAHQVGLRIMLDTMCGANDGAPVRAGDTALVKAGVLRGSAVPDYWQAFDNLTDPAVVSQGSLRGGELTAPHAILFADWGTLADEPWEPALADGQGFIRKGETEPDTAAALLWMPVALEPEKTLEYTTYYGIGDVRIAAGNLTLGLTAPAETTFAHERTEPFTVTGYLQNAGGFEARNVALALALPPGLSLVGGDLKTTYPSLKPNETVQESWRVRPNGKNGGAQTLALSASNANVEANKTTRPIQVNVPPSTITCVPAQVRMAATTSGLPSTRAITVNLAPAEGFYGVRFTVKFDPKVIAPLGAPFGAAAGQAFVDNGRLLEWSFDDSIDGALTITGRRGDAALLTQAEVSLTTLKFRTVAPGTSALTFTNAVALDQDGTEHPLAVVNGQVVVTP